MSDYGRVPFLEPISNDEEDEVVGSKKEPIFDKNVKKRKEKTPEQKAKLREHLAKAREKSLAVRKAKKEEKLKNKKPVGRPKRVKKTEVEIAGIPTTIEKTNEFTLSYPTPEKEIKNTEEKIVMEITENTPINKKVERVNEKHFDYDRLADILYKKMESKTIENIEPLLPNPQYPSPRQRQLDLEKSIREDERTRIKEEQKRQKEDRLRTATQKYFSRLPPNDYYEPKNVWDTCFNPLTNNNKFRR
jgi:hypothetical protein